MGTRSKGNSMRSKLSSYEQHIAVSNSLSNVAIVLSLPLSFRLMFWLLFLSISYSRLVALGLFRKFQADGWTNATSQPQWAYKIQDLPPAPCNVYDSFTVFLFTVQKWILERRNTTRAGLACEAVREANQVWGGVGVYTVCENFSDAGKSIECRDWI